MKAYKDFIVSPIGERYNNSTKVDDKELILNTEVFNHQYVNRLAKVIATPLLFQSPISVGDEVIVHHNVFRRWHDVKGREKNSRSYLEENKYLIQSDQIFLYKNEEWKATPGYSFIKPLKSINNFNTEEERPLVGVIKYSDGTFNKQELVGFRPGSEYEFVIENERLYRVLNKFITIKYEYQGNEEEYNPSWAQSS
mgnify:CR=1 FL=1|jgi:hypothetical protein|tara:strand:- start:1083 stop:1670 length:588 start_codon:yes stop_codon:yes gene_type:complete